MDQKAKLVILPRRLRSRRIRKSKSFRKRWKLWRNKSDKSRKKHLKLQANGRKRYTVDTMKHKKENAKMKIQLWVERSSKQGWALNVKPFNQFTNICNKTSRGKKKDFDALCEEYLEMPHNEKNWSIICGWSLKIGEFSLMEGSSTKTINQGDLQGDFHVMENGEEGGNSAANLLSH